MAQPALKSQVPDAADPTERLGELYQKEFRSIARNPLLQAEDKYSWLYLAQAVGMHSLGLVIIGYLPYSTLMLPVFLLLSLGLGLVLMLFQSIAHDCGHLAFFKAKKTNDIIGVLTSLPLCVVHFAWTDDHKAHHGKTNHIDEDPNKYHMTQAQIDYVQSRFKEPHYFLYFWFYSVMASWQFGLIAVQFFGLPLRSRTTLYWSADRPRHSLFNLVILAAFVTSLVVFCSTPVLVFGFILPYLVYQMVWFMLGYFQHNLGDSLYFDEEHYSFIRGVTQSKNLYFGPVLNYFFAGLGDKHLEHHMFPTVPYYRLGRVADQFSPDFRAGLVELLPAKPVRFMLDFFNDYYRNYLVQKDGEVYRKAFRFGEKKSFGFFLLTAAFFPVVIYMNHLKEKRKTKVEHSEI